MLRRRIGAVALAAALLTPGGTAWAASDDDAAAPAGSMVIAVVVPDHEASPAPSPSASAPSDASPGGELPRTGFDAAGLWLSLLGGLAALVAGAGIITARRRTGQR
ncbi:LPXTG cell wall anchor domain-containing protein [Microbacterium allomyrinae]|uniref:LPXTG cell wall anchor domain-containing protein n=1 Tax=Microbacterium allomyrinae TaxID=2830666 RepID=A0A9X1LVT4_9MICO|nr:LPXTG cell wall anchor domain-containing protein [Microbacterium allomyrinae]MCC2032631.1 LPXTG cell wall anchor domain-containing protein [Microbacterium allomyrinae]